MKPHIFHHLYANVPLAKRIIPLSYYPDPNNAVTLDALYNDISILQATIRSYETQLERRLDAAEQAFKKLGIEIPTT